MRGNEARRIDLEDQVKVNHMEARIAKLESDVGYITKDVCQLRLDMNAANGSLAAIRDDVSQLKASVPHLATKADLHKLETFIVARETKFLRWCVGSVLTVAALAFSIARFVL